MFPTLHDKLITVPVKVRCFTSVHSMPKQEGSNNSTQTQWNTSWLLACRCRNTSQHRICYQRECVLSFLLFVFTKNNSDDWQPTEGHTAERSGDCKHDIGGGEGWGGSQHGGGNQSHQKHRLTTKPETHTHIYLVVVVWSLHLSVSFSELLNCTLIEAKHWCQSHCTQQRWKNTQIRQYKERS